MPLLEMMLWWLSHGYVCNPLSVLWRRCPYLIPEHITAVCNDVKILNCIEISHLRLRGKLKGWAWYLFGKDKRKIIKVQYILL